MCWILRTFDVIGASGTAIGTGLQNTITIANTPTNSPQICAAYRCYNLVSNGYDDWFLPSIDELKKVYINRGAIGGFYDANYWSSSESSNEGARVKEFYGNAYEGSRTKNQRNSFSYTHHARAIRYF